MTQTANVEFLDKIAVYKDFIIQEEVILLREHAVNMFQQKILVANAKGPFRHYLMLDKYYNGKYLIPLISTIFKRIAKFLDIKNPTIDPMLGIISSYIEPGGFIHKHTDKYEPFSKLNNFRFNLMIERGHDIEYNPIIEDNIYDIKIGDAWSFNASKYNHETKVIPGPKPRIVYQFGFII